MSEEFHELRLVARTVALRGCSMFADLAGDDLEQIAKFVEVRRASRGDYLFREGDVVRGFFIVRQVPQSFSECLGIPFPHGPGAQQPIGV